MKKINSWSVPLMFCLMAMLPILAMSQNDTSSRGNETTTTTPTRLRIVIPVRQFDDFVTINLDPTTGENRFSGFAIEVFKAVANTALPNSPILFDLIPFVKPDGTMNGTFDDMLEDVSSQKYDGAVGEISILYSRTRLVDFTLPYLDTSISMLVPVKQHNIGRISLKELTKYIVASTLVFSFIVALLFWSLEHKNEKHASHQLSLAQSTKNDLVWRREMMGSMIQTRLVMILFFMMMLILIACYAASQASSLTTHHESRGFQSLDELIRKKANVGYRKGSYVFKMLIEKNFRESQLKSLGSEEDMFEMLNKGTAQGGVDAVVADTPNLKLFLDKHCGAFTIVPAVNLPAAGFGFAFRKGTDLAYEFSNGILRIIDNGQLAKIRDRTIGGLQTCEDYPNPSTSNTLDQDTLWILIAGGIGVFILISIILLLYCGIRCNTRKNKVVAYPCYLFPCC
ncbi:unnamed protein product [Amaranthus hypochondriacus]